MDIKKINAPLFTQQPVSKSVNSQSGFREVYIRHLSAAMSPDSAAVASPEAKLLDRGDKVLDLLEMFAGRLSDGSVTLRDMDPLVKQIESEANQMAAEAGLLGQSETETDTAGLAQIIGDVGITANVAALKYRRGDYI